MYTKSPKYCSLKCFPKLNLHLLTKSLGKNTIDDNVGLNVIDHKSFKLYDQEQWGNYADVLELEYQNASDDECNHMALYCQEHNAEVLSCNTFCYKIDYLMNPFCSHHILHRLNPKIPDCRYGERCRHDHADDFLLSTIIGYLSYVDRGREIILGCIHCFYNHRERHHVLCINILTDLYNEFDEVSVSNCFIRRFNEDIMPLLFTRMTNQNIGKYDIFKPVDSMMIDDDSIDADELIYVMYYQYY